MSSYFVIPCSKVQHRWRSSKAVVLLEVGAGHAVFTRLSAHFGLRAGQPVDGIYGWGLLAPGEDKQLLSFVGQAKPRLEVCEPPCAGW